MSRVRIGPLETQLTKGTPHHNTSQFYIGIEIQERLSRRGLSLNRWPVEDLALISAVFDEHHDSKGAPFCVDVVTAIDPMVQQRYVERNKREPSAGWENCLYLRWWNGMVKRERRTYAHLMSEARSRMPNV